MSERRAAQLPVEGVEVGLLGPVDDDPAAAALATLQADRDAEDLFEAIDPG